MSAHLSGASGPVSIYATPYGGAKTLVKRAAVNGSGNVSASYVLKRKTTFTAEYGDDAHSASTSAGKVVKVRALAALALTGNYGTSGKYRLYHVRKKAYLRGSVAPNHAGLPLKFVVQLQISGTWRTMASNSFPMQSNGSAYAYFYANFRGSFRNTLHLRRRRRPPRRHLALEVLPFHHLASASRRLRPAQLATRYLRCVTAGESTTLATAGSA